MAEKENQHIVPATFFRQFEIKDYKYPNHVWCIALNDDFQNKPVAKGINSSIFKIKNFYSVNDIDNKLILENFYANKLEPDYNNILCEINGEKNLSEIIRIRLIEWLFHSNHRTEFLRKNIQGISKWIMEMTVRFESHKEKIDTDFLLNSKKEFIESESKKIAKEIQLDNILDPTRFDKLIDLYITELKLKKWIIYKSLDDYPFITNDNPGFSLNISHLKNERIFNPTIHINNPSFNYLILSPKYCLYMEPFKQDDPVHLNAFNLKTEYRQITKPHIDFINLGTYTTSFRYVISNNLHIINKWNKRR